MRFFDSEDAFWKGAPGAAEVFSYVREKVPGPWGFDKGATDAPPRRTWAEFSHVALSGWGRDKLHVSASHDPSGEWRVTHTVMRAK